MFKTKYSKKIMFAALAVIPLIAFLALTIYAGGPEPKDTYAVKKGKIKGVVTVELVNCTYPPDQFSGTGTMISLVGKCNNADNKEDKFINEILCECCWPSTPGELAAEDEESMLGRFLEDLDLGTCFPDDSPNETLIITDIKEFINDPTTETITAVSTLRALQ